MSYRAAKAGLARDTQVKIDSQFDIDEAKKCLYWLGEMTGENVEIQETDDRREMADSFHTTLKDGSLLCRLIDAVLPEGQKIDFSKKSFQESKNQAFTMARERERIAIFINKCQEYGVPPSNLFQTDSLYERTNLVQVCTCIRALGIEAQSRPGYAAPVIWPKKNETNVRTFSEEQVQAGKQVISLQYGSNKGANQAGMSFGKTRMILD
ncbi:myophilin-like [Mya arenaria]|uniref:myophilin-like n=1 Tax=Mya arenaria TaxID=6604 RepID=UPI0022E8565E|nr:myophilin-like [Mya arenaria]